MISPATSTRVAIPQRQAEHPHAILSWDILAQPPYQGTIADLSDLNHLEVVPCLVMVMVPPLDLRFKKIEEPQKCWD